MILSYGRGLRQLKFEVRVGDVKWDAYDGITQQFRNSTAPEQRILQEIYYNAAHA